MVPRGYDSNPSNEDVGNSTGVDDGVGVSVGVGVVVLVTVGVTVEVSVGVGEGVVLIERVMDGVTVSVGVAVDVVVGVTVEVGVGEGVVVSVGVTDGVTLIVGVTVGVGVGDRLTNSSSFSDLYAINFQPIALFPSPCFIHSSYGFENTISSFCIVGNHGWFRYARVKLRFFTSIL
jgi:hypothetical protein